LGKGSRETEKARKSHEIKIKKRCNQTKVRKKEEKYISAGGLTSERHSGRIGREQRDPT